MRERAARRRRRRTRRGRRRWHACRRRRAPRRSAISPVAAFSSGGPARKARARPRTMITWSAQAGHVGAAGGRRAVHDADHRQPGGRQPGEVAERAAAVDELLDPVVQQVGAGRFDQVHERQLVLERDRLRALQLLEAHAAAARRRRCRRRRRPASRACRRRRRCRRSTPPPGTDCSGSSTSCSQPASVDSSRKGTPGSSRRATRSRGSSWPRLSNSGAALARSPRACALRSRATARSAPSVCARFAANASPSRVERERERRHQLAVVAAPRGVDARWKPSNGSVSAAGADLGPDALRVRRRAVDAQAGAGDERRRRREQEDDRRRDLALGAEPAQRHERLHAADSVAAISGG